MGTLVVKSKDTDSRRPELCESCGRLQNNSICIPTKQYIPKISYSRNKISEHNVECPICVQLRKILHGYLLSETRAGKSLEWDTIVGLEVYPYSLKHQRLSRPRYKIALITDVLHEDIGNIGIAETIYYDPPPENISNPEEVTIGAWIKGLIHSCQDDDGCQQRSVELSRLCRAEEALKLTLVDVQDNCIVQGRSNYRYTALSYVWGTNKSPYLSLRMENKTMLAKMGSLIENYDHIAPVIQDAMEVTKQMGERYLWVDILCVEQNNAEAKHHQIEQMDVVYQQALLTLVAFSGQDSGSHLPGVSAPLGDEFEERVFVDGYTWVARPRENIGHDEYSLYTWWYGRRRAGESPYTYPYRAWTFQEQLLSTRFVIFTPYYTLYSCHGSLQYPASWPLIGLTDYNWTPWVSNLEATWRRCIDLIVTDRETGHRSELTREKANQACWLLYTDLIRKYMQRKLTFESDCLNAFTGIIHCLERLFKTNFWHGIPEEFFHEGLLFLPLRLARRAGFPSWSWAGWLSPVVHIAYGTAQISYKSDRDLQNILIKYVKMDPVHDTLHFQAQTLLLYQFECKDPIVSRIQYFDIALFESPEWYLLDVAPLYHMGSYIGFLYWGESPSHDLRHEKAPFIMDETVELVALSSTSCGPDEVGYHRHLQEWPGPNWMNIMAIKSNERVTVGKIKSEVWQYLNPETKHFAIR